MADLVFERVGVIGAGTMGHELRRFAQWQEWRPPSMT